MRPTPTIAIAACLCLALLVAPLRPAHAEEASPPPRKAATDDARLAGEIGRALLSAQTDVRRAAVERLLQRLAAGGDLATFLDSMSRAQSAWADRHERLMEVWLHDAVHGDAAERERAVRLLTALGDKAIRRLALELRHARLHAGAGSGAAPRSPQVDAPEPAQPQTAAEPAAGTPRVYDLRDLFKRGMNPVQLRGLLQKAADAVAVKQFKTLFVVTAMDEGHEQLRNKLNALRVRYSALEPKPAAPQQETAKADGRTSEGAQAGTRDAARKTGETTRRTGPDAPPNDAPQALADEAPVRKPAPPEAPQAGAKRKAVGGAWHLAPELFHLPRVALSAQGTPKNRSQLQRVLPRSLLAGTREVVRTEDLARAHDWTRALRRIPDARTGLPLRGETRVTVGGHTALFAGKQIQYSKSVRRTKGGAWTIVTGTIPHGIRLELALTVDEAALRVDLVATRTDVGLPIPVVRVQPSAQAAPVELERPEWSTTRVRRSFDLPPGGGGALVSLEGLGSTPDDHVVLALTLRKP